METWQSILAWTALAVVYLAYAPWVAERLGYKRGRRAPIHAEFLRLVPVAIAAVAMGVALESWEAVLGFALFGFVAVRVQAMRLVKLVREIRRRRPVKPADRQRRIEERAARRRDRARALERYGPPV
jgi:hypothetical protein